MLRIIRSTVPAAGLLVLAACAPAEPAAPAYEIWAMDQGNNLIHIFGPGLEEMGRIDMEAHGARVPHMIDFTSDDRYAFVAHPATGNVAVIRAADREVVAILATGPRTHAVTVAPNDRMALVAVIGAPNVPWDGRIVELTLDLAGERFAIGRSLLVAEDPLFAARMAEFQDSGGAVCLDFTADGRYAYVSLGPEVEEGGLVVLDTESFTLTAVYPPRELPANCGTLRSPTGEHMFVNAGGKELGKWHAMDTRTHAPVHHGESGGHDAHGVWLTPDGAELWMVNRVSSNAIVINPATLEEIARIEFVGKTPDIIAMAPDGSRAYITLRGPNPVTMPHIAVGETPGFAVIDVRARELLELVQPDAGNSQSDFHGIAVRRR
jgi:YVTN family beta-propeller protein